MFWGWKIIFLGLNSFRADHGKFLDEQLNPRTCSVVYCKRLVFNILSCFVTLLYMYIHVYILVWGVISSCNVHVVGWVYMWSIRSEIIFGCDEQSGLRADTSVTQRCISNQRYSASSRTYIPHPRVKQLCLLSAQKLEHAYRGTTQFI